MKDWRAHLAALRAGRASAESAESAVSDERQRVSPPAGGNGANGAFGAGMESAGGAASCLPAGGRMNPDDAAERAAMAEHYAAPPAPSPWCPGDPDPLRDGLLAGWRAAQLLQQRLRLAALVQRLRDAGPKRTWGVRELDRQAWEAAAREAAGLPTAEWAAWRATVGSACR